MAEINIGSLGGSGGGGTSTWLKPEMESPANVEITSNQYLRFYKDPATGAYLEVNMSGANPTFRAIDTDGNIMVLDPDSLDFNSAFDPINPAQANYLPAEIRIKTGTGGDEAALYFICLDTNPNVNAHLDLVRGTWNTDFGSSDPVLDGMQIGELAFWGQVTTGLVLPGSTSNINRTARITVYATENYSAGARGSEMVLVTTQAGGTTQKENFRLLGTGQNQMTEYGLGNFTGTLTYLIGVTVDGEMIELDPSIYGTWLKPQLEAGNDVIVPDAQGATIAIENILGFALAGLEDGMEIYSENPAGDNNNFAVSPIGFQSILNNATSGYAAIIITSDSDNDIRRGADTSNYLSFKMVEGNGFYFSEFADPVDNIRLRIDTDNGVIYSEWNIGVNVPLPTSSIHLSGSGFAQCRLENDYTPTGTADANGATGDIAWDDNFFYVKTSAGWKRTALSTF